MQDATAAQVKALAKAEGRTVSQATARLIEAGLDKLAGGGATPPHPRPPKQERESG